MQPDATVFNDPQRIQFTECPLCRCTDLQVIKDQDWTQRPDHDARLHPVIRWMMCNECLHQFTWGSHTDEALDILFGTVQPFQSISAFRGIDIEAERKVYDRVVDLVSRHAFEGEWLDVGAGAGMLAAVAYECGFDSVVMESRELAAQALRDRGFTVMTDDVLDLPTVAPGRFRVISLCDVLEHTPSPPAVLDAIHAGLRDDGVLFISCPNIESLAWVTLDAEGSNPYWAEVEHYHNFGYRRLRSLLAEHGFQAVSCSVSNRYRVCMDVVAVKA